MQSHENTHDIDATELGGTLQIFKQTYNKILHMKRCLFYRMSFSIQFLLIIRLFFVS